MRGYRINRIYWRVSQYNLYNIYSMEAKYLEYSRTVRINTVSWLQGIRGSYIL